MTCGDDEPAKEIVAQLIADSGFVGVDAGSLGDAANLEPHGALYDKKLTLDAAKQLLASVQKSYLVSMFKPCPNESH